MPASSPSSQPFKPSWHLPIHKSEFVLYQEQEIICDASANFFAEKNSHIYFELAVDGNVSRIQGMSNALPDQFMDHFQPSYHDGC